MIVVEELKPGCFRIVMDKPEERLVTKVAAEFVISRTAAMTAIFYRGYDSMVRQIQATSAKSADNKLTPDADYGGD